jgi:hypothetical protein
MQLAKIARVVGIPPPLPPRDALVGLIAAATDGTQQPEGLAEIKLPELCRCAQEQGVGAEAVADALAAQPDRRGRIAADVAERWLAPRLGAAHGSEGCLDLRDSGLGPGGARVLAGCLVAPSLRVDRLLLAGCCLGDAAASAVAAAPGYWAVASVERSQARAMLSKHGEGSYVAMAADVELNRSQATVGELRRQCERYLMQRHECTHAELSEL